MVAPALATSSNDRHWLRFRVNGNSDTIESCPSKTALWEETAWRCPTSPSPFVDAEIVASRWIDPSCLDRCERAVAPAERHVFSLALRSTRLKLTGESRILFEGPMLAGTLHITGPSQRLSAFFDAPCDFAHFHVSSRYLRRCSAALQRGSRPVPDPVNMVMRSALTELLARALVEDGSAGDPSFVESAGKALVMHAVRRAVPRRDISALQKWRLSRVQEYVKQHLDDADLAGMASAAGLSRMHFAAQFRVSTGFRPHEFVLNQRVARAEGLLRETDTPLAEVALIAGFRAQSHFSSVFKRYTGETPARWRRGISK